MTNIETLIENVRSWGIQKGITGLNGKGTIQKQFRKFVEEMAELFEALEKNDTKEIRDALGDLQVVAVQANELLGEDISELLSGDWTHPYNDIEEAASESMWWILTQPSRSFRDIRSMAKILGHDPDECLQEAYDEIKGRTGTMRDGVFIKDGKEGK